jgi:hypothetical protein
MDNVQQTAKFYYDATTGVIENHCFLDAPLEQDKPYIILTYNEWCQKMQVGKQYYFKVYKNNEIIEEPDPTKTKEIRISQINNQIYEDQDYLSKTDYIITKLNELQLVDDESFIAEKAKYATDLQARKDKRMEINALQAELKTLETSNS